MPKVVISEQLFKQLEKKFSKAEANKVVDLMESLEDHPYKGKELAHVGNVVIKEIKYKKFRFYCIADGHMLKFGTEEELAHLLIKFVRMSEKKDQQKIISEIKDVLTSFGFEGL